MGFNRDYSIGLAAETLLCDMMSLNDIKCSRNESKTLNKYYDLECKYGTMEVKYDIYAARTGNLAIEVFNPKTQQKSGLEITKASLWAHILTEPHQVWIANVAELRRFVKQNKPVKTVECGGDSNATLLLYKKESVLGIVFHRLDNLSKSQMKSLMRKLACK